MHLCAFIAIFVPKFVAVVTPLCPLCMGVSQINSSMAQTLSQNHTLHGYVAYNWSYGHICDFLAKIWLPWQRPLDLAISNVFFGLVDHKNPRLWVIAFLLSLVEVHLYAIIAIFIPKLVAMVTPLCPLCTGVSQINSPIAQILSQNQTLHGYVAYNWSYGNFCDILAYFDQNLVAMATSLRPLQSEMSFLDLSTPKTIP